jgi:O-antigen/teichoic acid export membrane protein
MRKDSVRYRVLMLFLSNLALQLMGFAYRMALTRAAGTAAIGLNSLVMQFYGVVVSFCISGLNVAVTSLAARTDRDRIRRLFRDALIIFTMLWALAAAPLAALSSTVCERALGEPALRGTLLIMLFCIFMTGVENLLKSVHMGVGRVIRCAASELTEQAVRFCAVIILLRLVQTDADPQKVFLIMLGMAASEFVSVGILSASFLKLFPKNERNADSFIRDISGIAFPALLTAVSGTVFSSVGSLILPSMLISWGLGRNAALSEIGVMNASAIPLSMLPMAAVGAIAAVLMPSVCEAYAEGKSPHRLIYRSFAAALLIGIACSVPTLIFGEKLSLILFGCAADKTVFALIMLKAVVIFMQVVSVSAMNGLNMQRTVFVFAVTGEAYQLALIMLLTPLLGLSGYALGMVFGELVRLTLNLTALTSKLKNGYGITRRNMIKSP